MKEVQIVPWCDGDHDERVPAISERIVSIDRRKPILLDLCETCDKVFADMSALMDKGVPADHVPTPPKKRSMTPTAGKLPPAPKRAREGAAHQCSLCEHRSLSRNGLGAHVRKVHGVGLKEAGL